MRLVCGLYVIINVEHVIVECRGFSTPSSMTSGPDQRRYRHSPEAKVGKWITSLAPSDDRRIGLTRAVGKLAFCVDTEYLRWYWLF